MGGQKSVGPCHSGIPVRVAKHGGSRPPELAREPLQQLPLQRRRQLSPSRYRVLGYGDCKTPSVEPSEIVLTCGDYGWILQGLHWSSWTATQATAIGTFVYNDCTPNCAKGHHDEVPSTQVTLTAPVRGASGQLVWSKLAAESRTARLRLGTISWRSFPSTHPTHLTERPPLIRKASLRRQTCLIFPRACRYRSYALCVRSPGIIPATTQARPRRRTGDGSEAGYGCAFNEYEGVMRRRLEQELGMTLTGNPLTPPTSLDGTLALVHLRVGDADRAMAFFERQFGWQAERVPFEGHISHYTLNTAVTVPILDDPAAAPLVPNYRVSHLDQTIRAIEAAGGDVTRSETTPDGGGWAWAAPPGQRLRTWARTSPPCAPTTREPSSVSWPRRSKAGRNLNGYRSHGHSAQHR